MRKLLYLGIVLTLVTVAGCKGVEYHSDHNTDIDFTKYRTYAWNPKGNSMTNDPRFRGDIIQARIERSTEKAMAGLGLTKANSPADADLLVTSLTSINARITATQIESHYGYSYWYGSFGWATTYQAYYDQGTIVLDLMENGPGVEDMLVYRGYGTGGIEEKQREPEQMDRKMDSIMSRILDNYPGR